MSKNKFPTGWDEAKVRRVLAHYEGQTEEQAVREDGVGVEPSEGIHHRGKVRRIRVASSRIFISHSSKDKAFAMLVADELRKAHLDPWIDDTKILVGDDVIEKIGEGLRTMDLLLFVVSREALKSPWVGRELKFASMKTIRDKEIRILPFVVDDTPIEDLPWHVSLLHARHVAPNQIGAASVCRLVREVIKKRSRRPSPECVVGREFKGDPRLDTLIKQVKLGDWNAAELAALEIVRATDAGGRNELFETLIDYQDFSDEDPRLWGALHTIECCVRLAPWLITHKMISRMANHENFSVRSSAASICMDLAHSAPDRVPFDVVAKLSSYDEDWYVETPASSAIKAMARSFPAVLRLFFERLGSTSPEEREHAVDAICDIASEEPEILSVEELDRVLARLRSIGDMGACNRLAKARSKVKAVEHKPQYRYGF
ncbi:MAG TPA: toll/interleukin-1 receptor domain-containing protein [Bryobacteraceae bacterium]|nr:toll/interleukin-1 receptor domain-containing protein [Bryobacteraceae bacterium]